MYVCMYVFTYACMYVCMCVCICMYVCMHACIHTYIHTDIYILISIQGQSGTQWARDGHGMGTKWERAQRAAPYYGRVAPNWAPFGTLLDTRIGIPRIWAPFGDLLYTLIYIYAYARIHALAYTRAGKSRLDTPGRYQHVPTNCSTVPDGTVRL